MCIFSSFSNTSRLQSSFYFPFVLVPPPARQSLLYLQTVDAPVAVGTRHSTAGTRPARCAQTVASARVAAGAVLTLTVALTLQTEVTLKRAEKLCENHKQHKLWCDGWKKTTIT